MGFWIFMFIITLLEPLSLLLIWYICPRLKKINNSSGYRTPRSIKNQKSWNFAQKKCSKYSFMMFFPSVILPIIVMPFFINKQIDEISWVGLGISLIQMISYLVIFILTERDLKNMSDNRNK